MKCDICGINTATVHLTEVINKKIMKLHLCDKCAKAKNDEMEAHFGLTDLLSSLMNFDTSINNNKIKSSNNLKCIICGMTYVDFQKIGKFGCGKCYDTFSEDLGELLRKIHGSDRHVGKMPFKNKKTEKKDIDLHDMQEKVNEHIKLEEYEKASELLKKIKKIKTKENKK